MRGYDIDAYVNKKFNHLTLIKNLNKIDKQNSKLALFKCDCGKQKELVFTQVLNGKISSCGCLKKGKNSNLRLEDVRNKRIAYYMNNIQKKNKTGKTGISFVNNKYRARIYVYGKSIHLGYFDNIEDAIRAREEAEQEYFKPILNKYKTEN